jgi:hypothetical protein
MKIFEITKERLVIGRKEDASIFDLLWLSLWIVAFGSIPFLGMGMLAFTIFVALFVLTVRHQFPKKFLVFDTNKNRLIIKSKFLLWYPTSQYALNEIVEVALVTRNIYVGSMTVRPVDFIQLTRRRQNGRISQEDILCGLDANHGVVHQINRFLKY